MERLLTVLFDTASLFMLIGYFHEEMAY